MSDVTRDDPRTEVNDLFTRIHDSDDPQEWRKLSAELVSPLIAYWDIHPHSAMEWLEAVTRWLPVALAHPLVRQVVRGWRTNPSYDPHAGGTADHCYLSALILSENYDLAEHPWADDVLPSTLAKELGYQIDMRDRGRKLALVERVQRSAGP